MQPAVRGDIELCPVVGPMDSGVADSPTASARDSCDTAEGDEKQRLDTAVPFRLMAQYSGISSSRKYSFIKEYFTWVVM